MALLGSTLTSEVGLRLLLSPLGSNVVIRTACCSVGMVLPVYSTYKAIESKDNDEQHRWLLYWTVYGSFSVVEVFTDKLISWVPMYYHLKFAFLVWLQLPSVDGAKKLYTSHLRPFFLRHQYMIDQVLHAAQSEIVKLTSDHKEEIKYFRSLILKVTGSAEPRQLPSSNAIEGPTEATPDNESDYEVIEGPDTEPRSASAPVEIISNNESDH